MIHIDDLARDAVLSRNRDDLALGWVRYEHVRRLNPKQFADIWIRCLANDIRFDDLIDKLCVERAEQNEAARKKSG